MKALMIALCLVGCGGKKAEDKPADKVEQADPHAGGVVGKAAGAAKAVADSAMNHVVDETKASVEEPEALEKELDDLEHKIDSAENALHKAKTDVELNQLENMLDELNKAKIAFEQKLAAAKSAATAEASK